jgi:hypothetical protein
MTRQKHGPFKRRPVAASVPATHRAFVAHQPVRPQEPIAFPEALRQFPIAVDPRQRVRQRRLHPMEAVELDAPIITGSGRGI